MSWGGWREPRGILVVAKYRSCASMNTASCGSIRTRVVVSRSGGSTDGSTVPFLLSPNPAYPIAWFIDADLGS